MPTVYWVKTESLHIPPEDMRARALDAEHVSTIAEGMRSAKLEQLQNIVVNVYISDEVLFVVKTASAPPPGPSPLPKTPQNMRWVVITQSNLHFS